VRLHLLWVVLVTLVAVVLIIHVHSVLLSLALSLLPVKPVLTLGLRELIDLSSSEASEEFLGELVRNGLA